MLPLYDSLRLHKFPLVNWVLIGANVLAFLYETQLSPGSLRSQLRRIA